VKYIQKKQMHAEDYMHRCRDLSVSPSIQAKSLGPWSL